MKKSFAVTFMGFLLLAGIPAAGPNLSAAPQQADSKSQAPQKFVGVIVSKNGQMFVLRDDTNNVWYHLDDQEKAGKFIGKRVGVTGVLDGRVDEIRIKTIEEEKS
ncbi:MAG: DUF5818 domain-containing protein [Candidatus Acidiferrales bacterium]